MIAGLRGLTIALAAALVSGCAGRECCPPSGCGPTTAPRVLECRPAERIPVRPDVTLVAAQDVAPDSRTPDSAGSQRHAQCLAARNAPAANLLVQESAAAAAQPEGLCGHKSDSALTSEVLLLEAKDRRNKAAGDALLLFLKLLEAEGGAENLAQRGGELNLVLADIGRLQERGILSPVSKPETEGQRLELWGRQVELNANVQSLNFQLKNLLGVETVGDVRIWPQSSLAVVNDVPDKQQAVEVALANRADLAAIRLAAGADRAESQGAALAILQLAGGGLGTTPPTGCLALLLHHAAVDEQRSARSRQMAELLADRERTVRNETLEAVMILDARLKQIAITRRRLEVAQAHLQASQQQQQLTSVRRSGCASAARNAGRRARPAPRRHRMEGGGRQAERSAGAAGRRVRIRRARRAALSPVANRRAPDGMTNV